MKKRDSPRDPQIGSNGNIGKRLLNAEGAGVYLGLSTHTIYKKARRREIPSVKVGRSLRFDVAALDRYIEQHKIDNLE